LSVPCGKIANKAFERDFGNRAERGYRSGSRLTFDRRTIMSELKFNCPHCQQPLEVPEELLGQEIDCPACNGKLQLPATQSAQRTSAPPAAPRRAVPQALIITIAAVLLFVVVGVVVAILASKRTPTPTPHVPTESESLSIPPPKRKLAAAPSRPRTATPEISPQPQRVERPPVARPTPPPEKTFEGFAWNTPLSEVLRRRPGGERTQGEDYIRYKVGNAAQGSAKEYTLYRFDLSTQRLVCVLVSFDYKAFRANTKLYDALQAALVKEHGIAEDALTSAKFGRSVEYDFNAPGVHIRITQKEYMYNIVVLNVEYYSPQEWHRRTNQENEDLNRQLGF